MGRWRPRVALVIATLVGGTAIAGARGPYT
jgi:hypothetical protein